MKIKIDAFKNVMKKATLNYIIPSVQLKFEDGRIISNMVSQSMNAVIMLNMKNDVLDVPVSYQGEFNFSDPNVNVKTYLDLIDEEMADTVISDSNMKVTTDSKQKSCFHFASADFVSTYKGNKPAIDKWIFSEKLDNTLMDKFNKIKKIAGKFGKIYFSIDGGKLFLEATDKQNSYSNSMKFELCDVAHDDFNLCFDFNNINAFLTLVSQSYDNFDVKLHITDNKKGGMLLFKTGDDSEFYYFVSKNEQ